MYCKLRRAGYNMYVCMYVCMCLYVYIHAQSIYVYVHVLVRKDLIDNSNDLKHFFGEK